jgi:hypothetical protein
MGVLGKADGIGDYRIIRWTVLGLGKVVNRAVEAAPFFVALTARYAFKFPAILAFLVGWTILRLFVLTLLH